MPRDRKEIETALLNKGFRNREGDHHYYVYYTTAGLKSHVFTKTSHTPKMKVIGDELLSMMSRQCRLTKKQFLELVDCPLTRPAYERILAEQQLT
jgi:hypothetical protein